MTRRIVSLGIAVVLCAVALMPPATLARTRRQTDERAAKAKAEVARRVARGKEKVSVRLRGGEKLKGRISQAGEDSFTLTEKDGRTRQLAYNDVAEVKGQGGLPLGAKIGIGVGALAGLLAIIYVAGCHDTSAC